MVPNNDDDDEGSDTSSVDSIPAGGVDNAQYLNQFRWVQTNPHPAMRQMARDLSAEENSGQRNIVNRMQNAPGPIRSDFRRLFATDPRLFTGLGMTGPTAPFRQVPLNSWPGVGALFPDQAAMDALDRETAHAMNTGTMNQPLSEAEKNLIALEYQLEHQSQSVYTNGAASVDTAAETWSEIGSTTDPDSDATGLYDVPEGAPTTFPATGPVRRRRAHPFRAADGSVWHRTGRGFRRGPYQGG